MLSHSRPVQIMFSTKCRFYIPLQPSVDLMSNILALCRIYLSFQTIIDNIYHLAQCRFIPNLAHCRLYFEPNVDFILNSSPVQIIFLIQAQCRLYISFQPSVEYISNSRPLQIIIPAQCDFILEVVTLSRSDKTTIKAKILFPKTFPLKFRQKRRNVNS